MDGGGGLAFEPNATEDPLCKRGLRERCTVKSVELKIFVIVWTFGERGCQVRCRPRQSTMVQIISRPASMVAMSLGLQPSGFGFESRVRLGCIFFGKEVGLSPEMDSRLERKSSAPHLVICWNHRL
ncbi:hypothetical protein TNCV_4072701 [Trichonephila clavipes]|uniref:Uncharacterized protein n=1 Tax=Trichonephila clavipes TaxID=2585209 RepID=A0A8X7BGY0_TRICX|nr:hypothetical protein TNCV_4072701 [Trichonephila clavipes]